MTDDPLILRMGVRNGGCSGLSYVMDFSTVEEAITDDDEVDEYSADGIRCVVDAKSVLYLYGLELDYSDESIGGGFKFFNPNADESCGCGSSFGIRFKRVQRDGVKTTVCASVWGGGGYEKSERCLNTNIDEPCLNTNYDDLNTVLVHQ